MNLKPKLLSSAILSSLLLTPFAVMAEETPVDTGKMTVTGILPDRLESVPGSFDLVDEAELEQRRPFSIKEALEEVPGINIVAEDVFSTHLNIGVRGLDPRRSARTLLMEDGMPLYLAPYGDPSAHYSTPLDRVERIEVVKGSGQILYGPQTVGGMINFVTKPVPTDGIEGSVSTVIGNNNFRGLHGNIGIGGEAGGIMLDVLEKTGDGVRDNHELDIKEYTLKGQLNLTDRQTLIAKYSYFEEDSNISETMLSAEDYARDKFQAPTGNLDRFEQERQTFQLRHLFDFNDRATLSTQAYYVDNERASFRQMAGPNEGERADGRGVIEYCEGQPRNSVVATEQASPDCGGRWRPRYFEYWGVEARMDVSHNLFGLENDAVFGIRYHEEDIERNQFRGFSPDFQNRNFAESFKGVLEADSPQAWHNEFIETEVETLSYYLQNTFYAGDWAFTPGVRVEDIKIKTNFRISEGLEQNNPESADTYSTTEVLPGFGVAWNGIANTTVFAGVHKGFAPARPAREIEAEDPNSVDASQLGTDPEESWNYELGFRSQFYPGVNLQSTLFYTDFEEIVLGIDDAQFINAGETEQAGLEIAGRVDFGTIFDMPYNIYLAGSYTNVFLAEHKNDDPTGEDEFAKGNRLQYAPRHMANLALGYENNRGFDARISVNHVSEQYSDGLNTNFESLGTEDSGTTGKIPSYTLVNATVNYRPVGTDVTLFASVYNLADREYLASRVDGKVAGRTRQFFGGIRYDF